MNSLHPMTPKKSHPFSRRQACALVLAVFAVLPAAGCATTGSLIDRTVFSFASQQDAGTCPPVPVCGDQPQAAAGFMPPQSIDGFSQAHGASDTGAPAVPAVPNTAPQQVRSDNSAPPSGQRSGTTVSSTFLECNPEARQLIRDMEVLKTELAQVQHANKLADEVFAAILKELGAVSREVDELKEEIASMEADARAQHAADIRALEQLIRQLQEVADQSVDMASAAESEGRMLPSVDDDSIGQ